MEGAAVSGSWIVCLMLGVLYLAQGRGRVKWRAKIEPLMILRDDIMTACEMSLMAFEAARNDREHREPLGLFFRKCGSTQGLLWCEYLQGASSSVVKIFFARARDACWESAGHGQSAFLPYKTGSSASEVEYFEVATPESCFPM